jgi:hypothetical protein
MIVRNLRPALLVWSLFLLAGCSDSSSTPPVTAAPAPLPPAQQYAQLHAALGNLTKLNPDDPAAAAQLQSSAATIEALVQATRTPEASFEVDYSAGLQSGLPHLGQTRGLARVLIADAKAQLAAGNTDAAAQRVAATLRVSAQVTRKGQSLIELMTATAIASLATDFVKEYPALAKAAWQTEVQHALLEVKQGGTLNSAAIVKSDVEMLVRSLRENKMVAEGGGGTDWSKATQAERDQAAARLAPLADELARAWTGPDAVSALDAINKRVAESPGGELLAPFSAVRKSVSTLEAAIDEAQSILRK